MGRNAGGPDPPPTRRTPPDESSRHAARPARHQKLIRQHLRTHGTPAEAILWRHLQRRQVGGYKFRRQFGVGPYVLDFYCPAARLAVELDGGVHHAPEKRAYDAERTAHLVTEGIRVLRFENRAVLDDAKAVAAAIAAALGQHDGPPTS